ncbi:(deoxy)nucleoside triphosphate pyrophosphohydrolase [bacterium]|nr:(deoxy)nucleoside triphosphate pyrophosphohydrolase [bacterium]
MLVAAAVIERDGRFLLRRRPPGGHLAGLWEFPGGKVEPGEDWKHALGRELEEEIGIAGVAVKLIDERTFDYPERRVTIRFFWTLIPKNAEPRSLEENAPLRWATPEELLSLPSPDANREVIARLSSPDFLGEGERPVDTVVIWGLWGLPLAFVLAALTWMIAERAAGKRGHDLARLIEQGVPFPLVIGGARSVVLATFLFFEAIIIAIALRKRR